MANITSSQERNARKKIRATDKTLAGIENSAEELSEEVTYFPSIKPFGRLSREAIALSSSDIIEKLILPSSDLSKIFKDEASSVLSFSVKSPSQRVQYHEMDKEFDKAVAAITSAADTASRMTLELGEDLARIAAMRERIDRQNADNAKALKALLEGA